MDFNFRFGPPLELKNPQHEKKATSSNNTISDHSSTVSDLKTISNGTDSYRLNSNISEGSKGSFYTLGSSNYPTALSYSLGSHWKPVATVGEKTDTSGSSDTSSLSRTTITLKKPIDPVIRNHLKLQEESIVKVHNGLQKAHKKYTSTLRSVDGIFKEMSERWNYLSHDCSMALEQIETNLDILDANSNREIENVMDFVNGIEILMIVSNKQKIEKFIKNNEEKAKDVSILQLMIEENMKKVGIMRELMEFNKIDHPPLTTFNHDDTRTHQMVQYLTEWIQKLPFETNEKYEIERMLENVQKDDQLNGRQKCQLVFQQICKIMENWENNAPTTEKTAFFSSSFALTDDESNLNDLNSELRFARVRRAVEGPNNCIELGPWTTASQASDFSTDGLSSMQSLREAPMTMSSYEPSSYSFVSSVSNHSGQNELKTALSLDGAVVARPARSENSLVDEKNDELRSVTTLSNPMTFHSMSISDLLDDVFTAREIDVVKSQSLFESLQTSAKKCGVDLANLLSSSSVSESSTQSSASTTAGH